jgi:hypothetical protein
MLIGVSPRPPVNLSERDERATVSVPHVARRRSKGGIAEAATICLTRIGWRTNCQAARRVWHGTARAAEQAPSLGVSGQEAHLQPSRSHAVA